MDIVPQSVEREINKRLKDAGIDERRPFEMLAKLANSQKMTLDKYGKEHLEEDNGTQLKVAELVLKLTGQLERRVEEVKDLSVVHKMAPEDIDRLENIAAELKGLENRLKTDKIQQGKIIEVARVGT